MGRILAAIILGIALGFVAAHMLVMQWFTLVPWGIAGILLGIGAPRWKALVTGGVYGFVLCFVFLLAGYTGTQPVITRLPFFAVIGLFGALCGAALGFVGSMLKGRSTPNAT